jgi:hypothetical protein
MRFWPAIFAAGALAACATPVPQPLLTDRGDARLGGGTYAFARDSEDHALAPAAVETAVRAALTGWGLQEAEPGQARFIVQAAYSGQPRAPAEAPPRPALRSPYWRLGVKGKVPTGPETGLTVAFTRASDGQEVYRRTLIDPTPGVSLDALARRALTGPGQPVPPSAKSR